MPNTSTTSTAGLTVLRIVWAALLIGEAMFLIVITRMILPSQSAPRNPQPILATTSFAMCLTTIPVAFFLRMIIFRKSRQKSGVLTTPAYSAGNIIFWAACDGVAFFGMVAIMINGTLWPTIASTAIAMAFQVLTFPTGMNLNTPAYPPQVG